MSLIYFRFQLLGRKAQKNSGRLEVGGTLPPSDVDTLTHALACCAFFLFLEVIFFSTHILFFM